MSQRIIALTGDSRITQAKAATDEARTLAADILEQTTCPALNDARQYLNWALLAFDRAAVQIALKENR